MNVSDLLSTLNKLVYKGLAESWDNIGLQIGDTGGNITKCLLAVDVTGELLDYAKDNDFNTVIAHHPVIFKPLKNIDSSTYIGGIINKSILYGINIVALHTNLDAVDWGVSNELAKYLELADTRPIRYTSPGYLNKLAVFVPEDSLEEVRLAVCSAGGGVIGDYKYCTFGTPGQGTFQGGESTQPHIGQAGSLQRVDEIRLEVLVEKNLLNDVLKAMLNAHPYEEVAYDLYELANIKNYGIGKIGHLGQEKTVGDIIGLFGRSKFATKLGLIGDKEKRVKKVAVCGGSAGSILAQTISGGADLLVCGELGYHNELEAAESGLSVILLGHSQSEFPILETLKDKLQSEVGTVEIEVYNKIFVGPYWENYE